MGKKQIRITNAVPIPPPEPDETETGEAAEETAPSTSVSLFGEPGSFVMPEGAETISSPALVPIKTMKKGQWFVATYQDAVGTLGGKPAKNPLLVVERQDGKRFLLPVTGTILAAFKVERVPNDVEATAEATKEKLEDMIGRWLYIEFEGMVPTNKGNDAYTFLVKWLPKGWEPDAV
jgi:hypothetical protein